MTDLPLAPVTTYRQGEMIHIQWLGMAGSDAERLRELGLREGACACVMANTDKCILGIGTCRIALRRELAQNLFASPTE